MKRTLLLNNDFQPLCFIDGKRSLLLLIKERAEVVDMGNGESWWDDPINSADKSWKIPATLKLKRNVRYRHRAKFKKKVLFNRDNWECQYCQTHLTKDTITIDHVTPKCRGGETSWSNCVASCFACNSKKGSKTLSETHMKLQTKPTKPNASHFFHFKNREEWHSDWTAVFVPPSCI